MVEKTQYTIDQSLSIRDTDTHVGQGIISHTSVDLISSRDNLLTSSLKNLKSCNLLSRLHVHVPNVSDKYRLILTGKESFMRDMLFCIFSLIVVPVVCFTLGGFTVLIHKPAPVIDKSYSAFKIPNHAASLNFEAFKAAREGVSSHPGSDLILGRGKRADNNSPASSFERPFSYHFHILPLRLKRQLKLRPQLQYSIWWKLQIIFVVKENENIFTPERLEQIHAIEKEIFQEKDFSDFCYKNPNLIRSIPSLKTNEGCHPLNSLLTYFFPSVDDSGRVYFDGLGDTMVNIDTGLKLAMQSDNFYFYVDDKINSSNLRSHLLRTEVLFGAPLRGFKSPYDDTEKQAELFTQFVVKYIDTLSQASTSDMTVLYGGNEIFSYEVEKAFWDDVRLATYSLVTIFILMLLLTYGSVWLTICGLVSISCSIPLAIFFYRSVFGIVGLGILNGAAVFVIIGIGVDDVFVFINVFRQANHLSDTRSRVMYTIKTAGTATFFTSSTTAAAFAANIASMIPAVHDFGLFMTLIVSSCWITVMLIMPPALYIWSYSCSRCETCLTSSSVCISTNPNMKLPNDIANFMDDAASNGNMVTENDNLKADVNNLQMYSINALFRTGDMNPKENQKREELEEKGRRKRRDQFNSSLQGLLYHYFVLPTIRARWVILVVSTLLLVICAALMSQLHLSTRTPQFFRSTSNLQQLLDLKAKYSYLNDADCDHCSAIYSNDLSDIALPTPSVTTQQPTAKTTTTTTTTSYRTIPTSTSPTASPYHTTSEFLTPVSASRRQTEAKSKAATTTTEISSTPIPRPPTDGFILTETQGAQRPPVNQPMIPSGLNLCKNNTCENAQSRPTMNTGITVYVVFGIKDFHLKESVGDFDARTEGEVVYDTAFSSKFNLADFDTLLSSFRQLCTLCKLIASRTDLVRNGSADCNSITETLSPVPFRYLLLSIPECRNLPTLGYVYGRTQAPKTQKHLTPDRMAIQWLAIPFDTTTPKGKSYFEAFKDYQLWEDYLKELKEKHLPGESPLQGMFQTSDFWPDVVMEVVAVDSSIYSIGLSLVICLVFVAMFTRHILLLLVVAITIIEIVCCVVGIFYLVGWEIGGVEAVSLSILVGSSVDYCVHLVEGYILAAAACPIKDNSPKARHWRTSAALSHVGLSIINAALTTIVAVIPLTQTVIQPFAKFGQIIAINTAVSIVYTLTVSTALLSNIGPAFFKPTWKSFVKVFIATSVVIATIVLVVFGISRTDLLIPGPDGTPLFPK